MEQPLKPQPLMRHVLPGLLFVILLMMPSFIAEPYFFLVPFDKINKTIKSPGSIVTAIGVMVFFLAWIVGSIFDGIRNTFIGWIFPFLIDKCFKKNAEKRKKEREKLWGFLFTANREGIGRLDEYYYNYYVLDVNSAIGIFIAIIIWLVFSYRISTHVWAFIIVIFVVFILDAFFSYREMKELVNENGEIYKG